VFDIMRAYQLKMNLTKLFLGVSSGKFLEFIVTSKWIHLDPDKVKAIQSMQPPKSSKSSEVYKADSSTSEDSLQIFWIIDNRSHD